MAYNEKEMNFVAEGLTACSDYNNDDIKCLPSPLSTNAIISAIDVACSNVSSPRLNETISTLQNIRWKRQCAGENLESNHHHSLLYSIVGEIERDDHEKRSVAAETTVTLVAKATFYFAYSTWDGRIVYIDSIDIDDGNNAIAKHDSTSSTTVEEMRKQIKSIVYHTLADVAITLHCRRYGMKCSMCM